MSRVDLTRTTCYTVDPSGLPLGERGTSGTLYYLYDVARAVVMTVDPPGGSPAAIFDPCPTGNQAPLSWQPTGSIALDHQIHRGGTAGGGIYDAGTKDNKNGGWYVSSDSSVPTHVSFGRARFYDSGGGDTPGVGGLGSGGTITFYRGTTGYDALETVSTGEFVTARMGYGQQVQGVYVTTNPDLASYIARAQGQFGRNGGSAVLGIEVSADAFGEYAGRNGILVEAPMPQPPSEIPNATETIRPFKSLQEFYNLARFYIVGEGE